MEKSTSFAAVDVIAVTAVLVPVSSVLQTRQPNVQDECQSNKPTDRTTSARKSEAAAVDRSVSRSSSNNATSNSSRRHRKQLQHAGHAGSLHAAPGFNGYLYGLAVVGALYLVAIFGLACWECLVSPLRVQRLHDASLAVLNGISPFDYTQVTESSDGGHTSTPLNLGAFVPPKPKERQVHHVADDSLPVALLQGGILQPPRPKYRSNAAAKHISAEHGVLSGGIVFYRCGDLSRETNARRHWRTKQQSRDVVFLSAKTFFDKDQYDDAVLLLDDKTGERAFMELCHRAQQLTSGAVDSITALDIDESVSPSTLYQALQDLMDMGRLSMLPVAALVTPGASADTIVDWIVHGTDVDLRALRSSVARSWISVDADMSAFEYNPQYGYRHSARHVVFQGDGAQVAKDATDDNCRTDDLDENDTRKTIQAATSEFSIHVSPLYSFMEDYGGWPILAIHGALDEVGKQNAHILRDRAHGIVAIIGDVGANVLLEAPIEFGEAMFTYLEQESSFHTRTFRKEI